MPGTDSQELALRSFISLCVELYQRPTVFLYFHIKVLKMFLSKEYSDTCTFVVQINPAPEVKLQFIYLFFCSKEAVPSLDARVPLCLIC